MQPHHTTCIQLAQAVIMVERKFSTTTRPISGPMNLSDGAPNAKQAFLTAAFTLVSILGAALGALIALWSFPNGAYDDWNALRVVGIATGALITVFAFLYAFTMGNITVGLWQSYQKRLNDWHTAELDAYYSAQGTETTRAVSVMELTPDVAKDVLITALLIQYRLMRQDRWSHAPWSIRGLEEKLYLEGNSASILIGELTGTRPEAMSERLSQLGLVTGRKPGYAGDWNAQSYDAIFDLFGRQWNRLR